MEGEGGTLEEEPATSGPYATNRARRSAGATAEGLLCGVSESVDGETILQVSTPDCYNI